MAAPDSNKLKISEYTSNLQWEQALLYLMRIVNSMKF